MLKQMFDQVREKSPLIHNITNYVTVNDCANMVLACGASPIMADDKEEVAEIQTICAGLNINIGTLNSRTIESMKIAGMRANELGHPAVLDPVGVGASTLRTSNSHCFVQSVHPIQPASQTFLTAGPLSWELHCTRWFALYGTSSIR